MVRDNMNETYGSVFMEDGERLKSKIKIILDKHDQDKGRLLDGREVIRNINGYYNDRWVVINL